MQRIRLLVLILAAAVLGTAITAGSTTARTGVLPDERYTPIVASMEAISAVGDKATLNKMLDAMRAACPPRTDADELLAAYRAACQETVAFTRLSFALNGCKTMRSCARVADRMATSARRALDLSGRMNTEIDRTVPVGGCRTALRFSAADRRGMRRAVSALTDLASAARAGDEAKIKRAGKRYLSTRDYDLVPAGTNAELDAIKAHC